MTEPYWFTQAVFYHIYPLGLCGAPQRNDFSSAPVARLEKLTQWLDHIQNLGANAIYLGPVFESSAHGYDTADYFWVDRRLGNNQTLSDFAKEVHRRGMRLVLDGVFNHVGRDFWAFRDVLAHGEQSRYCSWFANLQFGRTSPYQDPFSYEGWSGNYDLVKLNLANPEVRSHIFDAVRSWVENFEIDGLRLDAADQIAPDFLAALSAFCRDLRPDFWLMGEVVFGDYRRMVGPHMLDSATNYECYKGLYSSHVDHNYFEIAYSLKRLFGANGIYRDLLLYSFADNHDVNRVASCLKQPEHLYPLHCLLFTMPGIPSIYYGSEWGITGERAQHSDAPLRPALELAQAAAYPHPDLAQAIARLAHIRRASPALQRGGYQELLVASEQLAFLRSAAEQQMVTAVNAANQPVAITLKLPVASGRLVDRLNPDVEYEIQNHQVQMNLPAAWGRILEVKADAL